MSTQTRAVSKKQMPMLAGIRCESGKSVTPTLPAGFLVISRSNAAVSTRRPTLAELNLKMDADRKRYDAAFKANTMRLTGKPNL